MSGERSTPPTSSPRPVGPSASTVARPVRSAAVACRSVGRRGPPATSTPSVYHNIDLLSGLQVHRTSPLASAVARPPRPADVACRPVGRPTPINARRVSVRQNTEISQPHSPASLSDTVTSGGSESSQSATVSSNSNYKPVEVYREHTHFYHHDADTEGPLHRYEEVALMGKESESSVEKGWHRYTYPEGLKLKHQQEFAFQLQVALATQYLIGVLKSNVLPMIKFSTANRRKFVDVCLDECRSWAAWNVNEVDVVIKIGNRTKTLTIESFEKGFGIGNHYARFDVPGYQPDPDKDPKEEGNFIVHCLNERLVQAKVIDAWLDNSVMKREGEEKGHYTWSGNIVCLVALFSDDELCFLTKRPRDVLEMQHGWLAVTWQHLWMRYPYQRFWCFYCKGSTPMDKFHTIRFCPVRKCLDCDGPRHQAISCPLRKKSNRNRSTTVDSNGDSE